MEFASNSIAKEMRRTANDQCIPLFLTFEISQKCNIACEHCYNFDRSVPRANHEELSSKHIHRIIDEVRDAGTLYLSFTGGEPLLHADIYDFIVHTRQSHMIAHLKTNGTLINEERIVRLKKAGLSALKISLYGATSHTHDSFTHSKGAFKRTIQGIKHAIECEIDVKLSFNAMKDNVDEISEMRDLARSLDVPYGIDPFITARYDGTTSSLDHVLLPEQVEHLYRTTLRDMLPQPDFRQNLSLSCSCARSVCAISSTGEVYPCIASPIPSGNLHHFSFHEIWKNSKALNDIRGLKNSDYQTCHSCDLRPYCRRNSGVIYSNTGQYTGPAQFGDDWTCMEASVVRKILQNT